MTVIRRDRFRSAVVDRRRARGPLVALCIAATTLVGIAHAHRAPGSLSTIEYNPRTDKTEVVHRLHSHDAELGVGTMIEMPNLSVLSLEGRAYIALYVEERFVIEADGKRVDLSLVGAELAADYVLVYQEYPGRLPNPVHIRDDILRDAFPEQINQVNIETDGTVRSLVFSNDDEWRRFEFSTAPP